MIANHRTMSSQQNIADHSFVSDPFDSRPIPNGLTRSVWEATKEAFFRITCQQSTNRFWERHLSANDLERLSGVRPGIRADYAFMKARNVDQIEAIIEVAYLLRFLDLPNRDWLRREWSLPISEPAPHNRPIWRRETGELCFRGVLIRKIRLRKKRTNLETLLNEFDAENWQTVITSPFEFSQHLYDTIWHLNEDLSHIQFHASEGGKKCGWRSVEPNERDS